MRILIVTGRFHGAGGTETFVRNISQGFIKRGHDVTVVSHQRFSEKRRAEKAKLLSLHYTFPSFHVPKVPMSYLPFYVIAKWLALLRLSKQDYDIVNAQGELEGFCALRARRLLRCPVTLRAAGLWHPVALKEVSAVYGDSFLTKSLGYSVELMEREVLKNSDAISTLNEQQKEILFGKYGVPPTKVRVIPHGVDTDTFSPRTVRRFRDELRAKYSLDGPVVLFVGRLAPVKRIDLLIAALAILAKEFPSMKLVLIGPPSYRAIDYYTAQAELLRVEKNLLYLGEVAHEDIAKYLALCDVYADVSEEYGIGFSTLEAMSCALPVVSTRPEKGVFEVDYHPESVANGIRTALTDRKKARILGDTARRYIEETHSFNRMVDEYIGFFSAVIREKKLQ